MARGERETVISAGYGSAPLRLCRPSAPVAGRRSTPTAPTDYLMAALEIESRDDRRTSGGLPGKVRQAGELPRASCGAAAREERMASRDSAGAVPPSVGGGTGGRAYKSRRQCPVGFTENHRFVQLDAHGCIIRGAINMGHTDVLSGAIKCGASSDSRQGDYRGPPSEGTKQGFSDIGAKPYFHLPAQNFQLRPRSRGRSGCRSM